MRRALLMLALAEALIAAVTVAAALYSAVAVAAFYWLWGAGRPYGAPVWPGVALGVAAAASASLAGGLTLRAIGAS